MAPGEQADGVARPRILLAEDDPSLREMVLDILTDAGYEVVAAANGREALERLADGRFDLLLVDEVMPGATGRELLARLRARGSSTPALLWSGHAALSEEERARLGVVEVLRKPVGLRALEEAVRRALGGA
jgi:CheY-like chemotaxis protein